MRMTPSWRAGGVVFALTFAACGTSDSQFDPEVARREEAVGVPALIRDIEPATTVGNSNPFLFTPLDAGRSVFFATGFGLGTELFVTDGTLTGTVPVSDLAPGTSSIGATTTFFTPLNGSLYFRGVGGTSLGNELFRT